ncbi:MAG: PIN domain-containing protein [Armatimonadota bacterium]|nr:PIN domain-containing protein [Armatimonadota bacterium]
MQCLVDTNVVLRWLQPSAPEHPQAVQALLHLVRRGMSLVLSSQSLVEFWNVATRPTNANGLGWTVERAEQALNDLEQQFTVVYETEQVYAEWKQLVATYRVSGRQVFDARLVAFMLAHGILWLLTFNTADFTRYSEIQVAHPAVVLQIFP